MQKEKCSFYAHSVTTPILLFFITAATAQNIGIGGTPARGRLEVFGAVGRTVATFGGEAAGVSLLRNPAGMCFNCYAAEVNAYSGIYRVRLLSPGSSFSQYLDMTNGTWIFAGDRTYLDTAYSPFHNPMLHISQNGQISLANEPANSSLYVERGNFSTGIARFEGSQTSSTFGTRDVFISGGKSGSIVLLNDKPSGNVLIGFDSTRVGINTASPDGALHVKQTNRRGLALINSNFKYWEIFVEKNLVESESDLYLYYNGNNLGNFYNGDGKYYSYSDYRLKTNIEPLGPLLDKIGQIHPVRYKMKNANDGPLITGLLAQELLLQFPELVYKMSGFQNGYPHLDKLHSVNYDGVGVLAIGAIQEQQRIIDKIKKEIQHLSDEIDMIIKLLADE